MLCQFGFVRSILVCDAGDFVGRWRCVWRTEVAEAAAVVVVAAAVAVAVAEVADAHRLVVAEAAVDDRRSVEAAVGAAEAVGRSAAGAVAVAVRR